MIALLVEPHVARGLDFTGWLLLLGLVIFLLGHKNDQILSFVKGLQTRLNLEVLGPTLFSIGALLWTVIFGLLFVGLLTLIWDMLWTVSPFNKDQAADWRFTLAKLTATTAILGAVVAFPVTLIRLALSQAQADTAQESLFNGKINAASADLHAMRQCWDGKNNIWEDDIVRRNAAIDRLEGLTIERPDVAFRVSQMLSLYVREMSKAYPAIPCPEGLSTDQKADWSDQLSVVRSDLEKAVRVLGRMNSIRGADQEGIVIDLRGSNLQGFDLRELSLPFANLAGVTADGADFYCTNLFRTQFVDASCIGTNFEKTDLRSSEVKKSKLIRANLKSTTLQSSTFRSCDLSEAEFSNANLQSCHFQNEAKLVGARFFGSKLEETSFVGATLDKSTSFSTASFKNTKIDSTNLSNIVLSKKQEKELVVIKE